MRVDLQAAHGGWSHLTAAALAAALPSRIDLSDVPDLPLARALDMPAQAGFARGNLGIKLQAVSLAPAPDDPLHIEQAGKVEAGVLLTLRVRALRLHGIQTLHGTQIWETGLDGAGTGLRFGERRHGGGAGDTPAHPTWLKTADDQRATLQGLPGGNGAALLSTYSNHRAAFTDAFTLPIATPFQNGWATDAISAMAQDTNDAVAAATPAPGAVAATGPVVNSSTKIYGNTTYNGNAQTQQLALATILTGMAANANPQNPADPTNPYNQAAASAVTFSSTVLKNTNAAQLTDVPPHTAADVYGVVAQGTPAPAVSVADVHTLLSGNPIGGRDADGNAWTMVLSEDDRAFVRKIQAEQIAHIARLAAARPVALVQGALTAQLDCFVHLLFAQEGGLRLLDGRVELDGFDLDFDDSQWDAVLGPELARAAREALGEARFIKSLLHDRVADSLERQLVPALAAALLGAP